MVIGEKRNSDDVQGLEKVSVIVLDIEGTTTSISFVKDTLFPYAREQLSSYLDSHWCEDELKNDVKLLKEQAKTDREEKVDGVVEILEGTEAEEKENVKKNVLWQMDNDRKTTALKQLQGHIWREGYKSGQLKGHIYGDVAPALRKWSEDGRRLCVYSSGSIEAQKLLFGNSVEGDLLSLFTNHFDTLIGAKSDTSSYSSIAKALDIACDEILFLTDVVKEAQAAKGAGLKSVLVIREGNAPLSNEEKEEFSTVTSFDELVLETSAKKKKMEESPVADKETDESATNHVNGTAGEPEKMEVELAEKPIVEETKAPDHETATETEKTVQGDVELDVVIDDASVTKEKSETEENKKNEEMVTEKEGEAAQENDDNSKNEALEKKSEEAVVEETEVTVAEPTLNKSKENISEKSDKTEDLNTEKSEEVEKSDKEPVEVSEVKIVENSDKSIVDKELNKEEKLEVEPCADKSDKEKSEEVINGKAKDEVVTNGEGKEVEEKKEQETNGTNGVGEEQEKTITVKKVVEEEGVEMAPEVEA